MRSLSDDDAALLLLLWMMMMANPNCTSPNKIIPLLFGQSRLEKLRLAWPVVKFVLARGWKIIMEFSAIPSSTAAIRLNSPLLIIPGRGAKKQEFYGNSVSVLNGSSVPNQFESH